MLSYPDYSSTADYAKNGEPSNGTRWWRWDEILKQPHYTVIVGHAMTDFVATFRAVVDDYGNLVSITK